ncbi:hypothetical protein TorRG33x02_275930 [Trema orientale]|uniref:Uncharacterized protein n=1 Tax=Trema orientale TaxID=63057 RepID=A0A2P5CRD4_TREOI|nr:hypothetical protein TorRG33x02_275930 [Trema orientale]
MGKLVNLRSRLRLERLRKDIDLQNKKKKWIGSPSICSREENPRVELKTRKLYKVNNKQETRIRKTEHLLQVAELYVEAYWNEYGKPAMDISIRQDWIAILKEQWLSFVTSLEPCIQLLTAKIVDAYYASKSYIAPRAVKVLKDLCSYTREAKKLSETYMHQTARVSRSHLDKVYVSLKPYTVKALQACREFMTSSALYHHQFPMRYFVGGSSIKVGGSL